METSFSCIIVDDEQEAIELLKGRLQLFYDNIEVLGAYTSWKDAVKAIRADVADILLLDISMPEYTGFDLLKLVPGIKSEVIFTTAYSEYAIEAFKVSATGYLLKPIDDKELVATINRSLERVQQKRLAKQNQQVMPPQIRSKIGIPQGKGVNYVSVDDIYYFEALNNYTKVVTTTGTFLSSYNIGRYHIVLQNLPFHQVHRSYIVNLNYVGRYEANGLIVMLNKAEIPVAKKFRDSFLQIFSNHPGLAKQ